MTELLSIKRKLEFDNTIARSQDTAETLVFVKNKPGLNKHPQMCGPGLFSYLEIRECELK